MTSDTLAHILHRLFHHNAQARDAVMARAVGDSNIFWPHLVRLSESLHETMVVVDRNRVEEDVGAFLDTLAQTIVQTVVLWKGEKLHRLTPEDEFRDAWNWASEQPACLEYVGMSLNPCKAKTAFRQHDFCPLHESIRMSRLQEPPGETP